MRFSPVPRDLPGRAPVVLELDLARGLIEHRPDNPLKALQQINATTMQTLRETLHRAAQDERVRGLVLHAADAGQPISVMEELGDLVEEFGRSTPTIAWAQSFGEMSASLPSYLLASAAEEIWLQPTGELFIPGVELHITLLKGLLTKAGVHPQFGQRHEFKTAADRFAADAVTEPNREMTERLAQSVVENAVSTIARRRGLTEAAVREAIDEARLPAERARTLGLVDHLGYRDQVYSTAVFDGWGTTPEQLRFVSRYRKPRSIPALVGTARSPKVAQVSLRGAITTGRGRPSGPGGPSAGADVVDEHVREVMRDDRVRAVVFTIDSPGGSAVASDFIRRSVLRLRESGTPVVAQMGPVAASGGYYAAMGCDEIVALPSTLTGSIGVVAGKLVTQGLYEKLDLTREAVRVGARAGAMSSLTEFTESDWEMINASLDRIYEDFTRFAAADRGMDHEQLEPLARGRVWTGADAQRHGLIDHLGGWRRAWERACELADLDPEHTALERAGRTSLLDRFSPARSSESGSGSGTGVRLDLPGTEELITRGARLLGLPYDGALSLPHRIAMV